MPQPYFTEKEKAILALETRKHIYETIRIYPGIHSRAIERKTQLATGTVKHHLQYLKKHDLIREQQSQHHLRYFPTNVRQEDQKLLSLLRNTSLRRILLYILTHKHTNQQAIAAFIKLSPQTTSWHLKKLLQEKIITQTKHGREVQYTLAVPEDVLITIFITYKKSFLDTLVDRTIAMWEHQ